MKLKKILCAVTALTMSISSFAGLTLSAKADDTTLLPKIDDNYAEMSSDDLTTAAGLYTLTTTDTTYTSVKAVEGSGIQLYTYVRYGFEDIYAARTLSTKYDGKDIIISGVWDSGSSTIGNGGRVYLAFQDSSRNDIFRLSANRNNSAYWYSIGGGDEVQLGKLGQKESGATGKCASATITFKVVFDTVNNAITSADFSGTCSNGTTDTASISESTTITAGDLATVRMGRTYSTDPKDRQTTNSTLKSLNIQEVPEATSAGVTGDDEINIGESLTYTPVVLDQYGDVYSDFNGTVSLALKEDVTGVTLSSSDDVYTLAVADTATAGDTITLVATATGSDDSTTYTGEKTVTISNTTGYTVTTNPYSKVYVDDTLVATVQSSGVVELSKDYADENTHTLKITKEGYKDSKTTDLTLALNKSGTYTLTPTDSTVTYYEGFENVTDGFGFDSSAPITISDGILKYTGDGSSYTADMDDITVGDKLITLKASGTSTSGTTGYSYITLGGLGYTTNYQANNGGWRLGTNRTWASGTLLQLVPVATDDAGYTEGRVRMYMDGKYIGEVGGYSDLTTLTGLTLGSAGAGTISIDYMQVSAKPDDVVLTFSDNGTTTTTTYLSGSTATLPSATGTDSTFLGWTTDGTTLLAAGSSVTVSADTTYTAKYLSDVTGADTLTTTVDRTSNGDDSTDTITFTTTYSGDDVATAEGTTAHGYVFVNFDKITSLNFGTEVSGAVTEQFSVPFNSNGSSVGFENGESFKLSITDIPSAATFGLYGIPYLTKSATETIWGAPATAPSTTEE